MGAASPEPELRTNYLRPNAEADLVDEIAAAKAQLITTDVTGRIESQGALRRRIRRMENDLESQKLPDLEGPQLDAIAKETKELEAAIRADMPDRDMMMRNPPGAVGKNIEFERKHKQNILRWKRNMMLLHRDSNDPDIANAERLRPQHTDSLMNMQDAQIAPKTISHPSPQYMANYEQMQWEGQPQSQESQSELLERLERLEAELAEVRAAKTKKRRPMSPEQKERARAALAKARAVKAAKGAEKKRSQQDESTQAQESTSEEA